MAVGDPCMESQPAGARNYFLACYAISLIQGETILGTSIRHQTVKNYLGDAYSFFDDRQLAFASDNDYVKIVLHALRRYEEVPNRRHMITDTMMIWLRDQATRPCSAPDGELSAVVDWIILGRYTGFRKSEWCQSTLSKFDRIEDWPGQPARAFIRSDFVFLGKNEELIADPTAVDPSEIHFVRIRWRCQKNLDNGQTIPFARDDKHPTFCPVRAALRICLRAIRLRVPSAEPIGVFRTAKGVRRFITDTIVTALLRKAASTVLNINAKDPYLTQWSCHSIRVTAANLLHRARFSDSFIQNRLRWRSTSFLMYLRNTTYAATDHTKALDISDSNLPALEERTYRVAESHELILAAPAA